MKIVVTHTLVFAVLVSVLCYRLLVCNHGSDQKLFEVRREDPCLSKAFSAELLQDALDLRGGPETYGDEQIFRTIGIPRVAAELFRHERARHRIAWTRV